MNCPNCQNPIGCACSGGSALTNASDGKQVCTKCKDNYEAIIVAKMFPNQTSLVKIN